MSCNFFPINLKLSFVFQPERPLIIFVYHNYPNHYSRSSIPKDIRGGETSLFILLDALIYPSHSNVRSPLG